MAARELKKVRMPNENGFSADGRPDTEELKCKADCK
jgi:S-disulfanyl-L-cysteine oxidoreductase SoxD